MCVDFESEAVCPLSFVRELLHRLTTKHRMLITHVCTVCSWCYLESAFRSWGTGVVCLRLMHSAYMESTH